MPCAADGNRDAGGRPTAASPQAQDAEAGLGVAAREGRGGGGGQDDPV